MTVRLPGARTGGRNELLRKEETAEAPGNAPEPWGGMEKNKNQFVKADERQPVMRATADDRVPELAQGLC